MIKKLKRWMSNRRTIMILQRRRIKIIMKRNIPFLPKCWVFEYWFTVLRHGFFWIGAWQLDILVAPLVWEVRDKRFYFLYGSLSFWEVYPLFFSTLAIGFFMIEIVVFIKWLQRFRKWWNK